MIRPHVAAAETALTKVLSAGSEPCLWHMCSWAAPNLYQPRGTRHCRMRAGVGTGSKFGQCPRSYWCRQSIFLVAARRPRPHINEALRSQPARYLRLSWMAIAGIAKLTLGSDEEAVDWLRRAIEANPNYPAAHFWLAAALAHLGRFDEARAAVQAGLRSIRPSLSRASGRRA